MNSVHDNKKGMTARTLSFVCDSPRIAGFTRCHCYGDQLGANLKT